MDPISNFITALRNASMAKKKTVIAPHSELLQAIAEKLRERGFLATVAKRGKKTKKTLEVELAMNDHGKPKLSQLVRVSKPGRRMYVGQKSITSVRGGFGVLMLSTPKGVLTGEEAQKEKVGGEVLFKAW